MGSCNAAVCWVNWSYSICSLPGTNPWLCNLQKPLHTMTKLPPFFMVDKIQRIAALSSSLCRTSILLFELKTLNFDLSVQRTLLQCSLVQFLCALAHWSLLTLFCFLNTSFLRVILPYRAAPLSLLLIVDVDNFFSRHWSSCTDIFVVVRLLSCELVADEIVLWLL